MRCFYLVRKESARATRSGESSLGTHVLYESLMLIQEKNTQSSHDLQVYSAAISPGQTSLRLLTYYLLSI
jgi:hypothetical protein